MLVVENAFITVMTTGGLRHIESMAAILGQSLEPDYLLFCIMGHLPREGYHFEYKKILQNRSIILL